MTSIQDIQARTAVRFSKTSGCPKCLFLENTLAHSPHKDNIETVYITEDNREAIMDLGIRTAPVMAIVENGKVVEFQPDIIIAEQLDEFMAKL